MLGYQINPYKYLAKCDLFVCSSYSEGLSTAVTEALILGVPVCTTDVSGMRELLEDGKYGMITENSEDGLCCGIKTLIDNKKRLKNYKKQARIRQSFFEIGKTVNDVEKTLTSVLRG